MSTAFDVPDLRQTAAATKPATGLFRKCWTAFQARCERERLRSALYNLSDRDLKDIGTSRGEIEFIASHRSTDPRAE